jgi:hypothetical protein
MPVWSSDLSERSELHTAVHERHEPLDGRVFVPFVHRRPARKGHLDIFGDVVYDTSSVADRNATRRRQEWRVIH